MQLRVLRFGLSQDGDVGVGVFPEGEEVLVSGFCFGTIALHRVAASQAEMGKGTQREVHDDATVIHELLKLSGCSGSIVRR